MVPLSGHYVFRVFVKAANIFFYKGSKQIYLAGIMDVMPLLDVDMMVLSSRI